MRYEVKHFNSRHRVGECLWPFLVSFGTIQMILKDSRYLASYFWSTVILAFAVLITVLICIHQINVKLPEKATCVLLS